MGVFSAVAGNQLPNQLQKSTTGSLPPAVPLAITPTFSPWTHTSDDSYIYQLSLVLATAIVSFILFCPARPHLTFKVVQVSRNRRVLLISYDFFAVGVLPNQHQCVGRCKPA